MKLFTKDIDKKLFAQYEMGNDLENQMVVAKIFNPYGRGVWYILNSDPNDPDYLWAIVDLFDVEMGSVSRLELESIKVPPFGLPLERDLYFTPRNAKEVFEGALEGKRFKKGGTTESENAQMVLNQNKQIAHHTEELPNAVKKASHVPAWVVAKVNRSANDISDATHYLDGESSMMAEGGGIDDKEAKVQLEKNGKGEYFLFPKDPKGKEMGIMLENGGDVLDNDYSKLVGKRLEYGFDSRPNTEKWFRKISKAEVTPKNYRHRDLIITNNNYYTEVIKKENINDFLKGEWVELRDSQGEYYVVKLIDKVKFEDGGGVNEFKVGDIVYVHTAVVGKGVESKKGKIKSIGEKTARVIVGGKESGYLLNNISKEPKEFKYLDMELGKFTGGGTTEKQQKKISKVMHEFKAGDLKTSAGTKVTNPKQAVAIALSEAGVSKKGWSHKKAKRK